MAGPEGGGPCIGLVRWPDDISFSILGWIRSYGVHFSLENGVGAAFGGLCIFEDPAKTLTDPNDILAGAALTIVDLMGGLPGSAFASFKGSRSRPVILFLTVGFRSLINPRKPALEMAPNLEI